MRNQNASPAIQPNLPFDSLSQGKGQGRLYQNKDWLNQKYWDEELSMYEIAKLCFTNNSVIFRWLRYFNIKTRTKSEAGKGRIFSEEHKRKIGDSRRGISYEDRFGEKKAKEIKIKISISQRGKKNYWYGKHHNDETKAKISKANKGRKCSKETRELLSRYGKGRKKSEAYKRKMAEIQTYYSLIQERKILEFYSSQFPISKIAEMLNLSWQTVRTCLKRNKIEIRNNNYYLKHPNEKIIVKKETCENISKALKLLQRKSKDNPRYEKILGFDYDEEGKIILRCQICNKNFKVLPCLIRSRKNIPRFCSRECSRKAPGLARELNPRWLGGISFEPYGLDFNDELKKQIRKRDNYKCQKCGIKENGKAHDCHHIDYYKQNNKPENLITLCRVCHIKTNSNRKYWQNYFKFYINAIFST